MKRRSVLFLKMVIVLLGLLAVVALLVEPHFEGRNAHATFFEIYFQDPFLAYAYIGSIPFFVALHQGFKTLGYAEHNKMFSPLAVKNMQTIKHCAIALLCFVIGAEIFMRFGSSDDRAGGVAIGVFIAFCSVLIAAMAATFERILQSAVDIKAENELTV